MKKSSFAVILGLIAIFTTACHTKSHDVSLDDKIRKELADPNGFFFNQSEAQQESFNISLENNYPQIKTTFTFVSNLKSDFTDEQNSILEAHVLSGSCQSIIEHVEAFMPQNTAQVAQIIIEDKANATLVFKDKDGNEFFNSSYPFEKCDGFDSLLANNQ